MEFFLVTAYIRLEVTVSCLSDSLVSTAAGDTLQLDDDDDIRLFSDSR